jgi:EAL domain-containing protein (putative c-di-GMP-specific phosphodiesterase class I)
VTGTKGTPLGPYWYLVGFVDTNRKQWRTVIRSLPLRIGRRSDADLYLYSTAVSHEHAEIFERDGSLWIRDLGSTNGTFVNTVQVEGSSPLKEGDTLHFGDLSFRLSVYRPPIDTDGGRTRVLDTSEMSVHLLGLREEFAQLMAAESIVPYFQEVQHLDGGETLGYELLSRGRLGGLETVPTELFFLAERLGMECELSDLCRRVGVRAALRLGPSPLCFLNTHPGELQQLDALIQTVSELRQAVPDVRMSIEIHEAAVTVPSAVRELRERLEEMEVTLTFDDFGAGQSRLAELGESPPHYLKFDMRLIRNLHTASPERYEFLTGLVAMARRLGIVPIAEGVESKMESTACREVGFEYAQGYFLSLPRLLEERDSRGAQ